MAAVITETHSLPKHCEVLSPKWDISTFLSKAQGPVLENRRNVRAGGGGGGSSLQQGLLNTRCCHILEPTGAVITCTRRNVLTFCYEGERPHEGLALPEDLWVVNCCWRRDGVLVQWLSTWQIVHSLVNNPHP